MEIIEIKDLTKTYKRAERPSVDAISLKIHAGEVYGFLGANGAGKSTTLRTVMDFIRPTSGEVILFGMTDSRQSTEQRRRIGYLAGDVALPKNVTGEQLLGHLAKLGDNVDQKYLHELTTRFSAQLDKPIGKLSKGNRQKIGLVQAFMHKPELLVLDEPTSGLDPLMQEQFYKTIHEARERGAAVFLSSHSFEEVEHICDRIGIIREGKLVYEGPISEIVAAHVPRWRVVLTQASDIKKLQANKAITLTDVRGASVTVEPTGAIEDALAALSKVKIVSMTANQNELEDEFLRYYGEDKEGC